MQNDWLIIAQDVLDYGIMGILFFMSVLSVWVFIERLMFFKSVDLQRYESRELLELELSDNLSMLSAVGSNAPYIGLIGTILGIMITFYTLGDVGSVDPKKIMTGLALALKATGLGIIVAVPAILFYTIVLRKIERLLTYWEVEQK